MRVEHRLAIHQEHVFVVAMIDFNAGGPPAIGLPYHWSSVGIPAIEVAYQRDLRRLRGVAEKAGAMKVSVGRVLRQRPSELKVIEHNVSLSFVWFIFSAWVAITSDRGTARAKAGGRHLSSSGGGVYDRLGICTAWCEKSNSRKIVRGCGRQQRETKPQRGRAGKERGHLPAPS